MYSLWGIYKEKPSYLVNLIYLQLQKWNLTLVLQIINIEKPVQGPRVVAQSLTGEKLKALFKWRKSLSLFLNNGGEKKEKENTEFCLAVALQCGLGSLLS